MSNWVPPGSADTESERAAATEAAVTDDDRQGGEPFAAEEATVVRHEEEVEVGVESHTVGTVDVRKRVEHEQVSEVVPRSIEHFDDVDRVGPLEGDSGQVEVLPDGSVSIPILEEELVIQKRTVVRERVIVRKRTETQTDQIETTVRKERVEIEGVEEDPPGRPA
jgi:uncharacterized protein (TIGR02271 family)